MLKHIAGNGVRTIIVETANRFARDLITQETGWRFLRDAGIALIAADSPDAFLDDTPTTVMIRQILGSVAQFEKAMLVAKLRGARQRMKAAGGDVGPAPPSWRSARNAGLAWFLTSRARCSAGSSSRRAGSRPSGRRRERRAWRGGARRLRGDRAAKPIWNVAGGSAGGPLSRRAPGPGPGARRRLQASRRQRRAP